jgi:predicted acyltransferase
MIFVNELAAVHDIPQWMKHMPRDADAMSFVDVVFPGFLFIVGMSIPFAINNVSKKAQVLSNCSNIFCFEPLVYWYSVFSW